MDTICELRDTMHSYKDVAVGMQVKDAIIGLLKEKHITLDDELSSDVLRKIYKYIDDNKCKSDPELLLFQAIAGQTKNPIEAALKYIDQLRSLCKKCS